MQYRNVSAARPPKISDPDPRKRDLETMTNFELTEEELSLVTGGVAPSGCCGGGEMFQS